MRTDASQTNIGTVIDVIKHIDVIGLESWCLWF